MVLEIQTGDIIRLKKKHPCGGYDWQVFRTGADIGLQCLECRRRIILDRTTLERRLKSVNPGTGKK